MTSTPWHGRRPSAAGRRSGRRALMTSAPSRGGAGQTKGTTDSISILTSEQHRLWEQLVQNRSFLDDHELYLGGGAAVSVHLSHRSVSGFDFFSQQRGSISATKRWLESVASVVVRDIGTHVLHADVEGVPVSVIIGYPYPAVQASVDIKGLPVASRSDLGAMKLLTVSHRQVVADFVDLAALFLSGISLEHIIGSSQQKFGRQFNPLVSVRALACYRELADQTVAGLEGSLAERWPTAIKEALGRIGPK